MLRCDVLCCAVLWYVVLCCIVLCCAVVCCAVLCCSVVCCAVEQVDEQEMGGSWEEEQPPERLYRPRHKSYKAAGGLTFQFFFRIENLCTGLH